jgi:hypothetical protein
MSLIVFCHWLARTHLGVFMRDSTYGFAVIEMGHLLSLAVFGGAVLMVDLRFLGFGFKSQTVSQVAKELLPLTVGGVIAMSISGFLLFMGGPSRYYHNPAFQLKMILFVLALVFHFGLQFIVSRGDAVGTSGSLWLRLSAVISLALWFTIGLAGRAIGYV